MTSEVEYIGRGVGGEERAYLRRADETMAVFDRGRKPGRMICTSHVSNTKPRSTYTAQQSVLRQGTSVDAGSKEGPPKALGPRVPRRIQRSAW